MTLLGKSSAAGIIISITCLTFYSAKSLLRDKTIEEHLIRNGTVLLTDEDETQWNTLATSYDSDSSTKKIPSLSNLSSSNSDNSDNSDNSAKIKSLKNGCKNLMKEKISSDKNQEKIESAKSWCTKQSSILTSKASTPKKQK